MLRFSLSTTALIIFGFACWIGNTQDKPATVTILCGAAIFCLIFTFLSKFKKFKGLGIEAEMWEQVQNEAETMIKELRRLALATASPVARLSATIGYWDCHFSNRDLYKIISSIEESLNNNGVSKAEIETLKLPFHGRVIRSFCAPIKDGIAQELREKHLSSMKLIDSNHPKPIQDATAYGNEIEKVRAIVTSADEFSRFKVDDTEYNVAYTKLIHMLDGCGHLSAIEKEGLKTSLNTALDDLQFYCKNSKFRELQRWLDNAP